MMRGMTGRAGIVALSAMLFAGCSTTTEQGAVGVERRQLLLVSSAEMEHAAAAQYQNVLKEETSKGHVNQNPQQVERVRAIAKRLIPQTPVFRKDALDWKWEVNVLTSPEINAWCMPGGKIAVYTGIIEKLQITDDELAAVMGHEIAHALREHGRERASQQIAAGAGATLLGAAADIFSGTGQLGTQAAGLGSQVGILLPYSRLHETEADRMGSSSRRGRATILGRRSRCGRRWASSPAAARRRCSCRPTGQRGPHQRPHRVFPEGAPLYEEARAKK